MKLKTLLLGSAAALMATTGAKAADAVVAEPEPVEYVRVCELYGNGFFFIPGTETCLNFNGYVRGEFTYDDGGNGGNGDSVFGIRARLNIDARNETDYGTLRSQIRFQGTQGSFAGFGGAGGGGGNVIVDRALISLAGFRLGFSDSFTTTLHGYGLPVERQDGYYGFDQAFFFDYQYSANGFTIGGGVQETFGLSPVFAADFYIGASYSGSLGSIAASYIYETRIDEGAYKISGTFTGFEGLVVKAFGVFEDGGDTNQVQGTGDYAWGIGASYSITDTIAVNGGYSDADGLDDFFVIGARWNPVPGLSIRPEIAIFDDDDIEYSVRVYRTF